MIAAVILAAGRSQRLGRPKQLLKFEGMTLVARACMVAQDAGCSPIIVVTGAFAEVVENAVADLPVEIARNPQYARGMSSSIAEGIRLAAKADGALIMTVDQPLITAVHLRALTADADNVTGTAYGGIVGIPAYFPRRLFVELAVLDGDRGAKALLYRASGVPFENAAFDIDTLADLERLAAAT